MSFVKSIFILSVLLGAPTKASVTLSPSDITVKLNYFSLLVQSSTNETVVCSLYQSPDIDSAYAEISSPTCLNASPPVETDNWLLLTPTLSFPSDKAVLFMNATLIQQSSTTVTELLVASCCGNLTASYASALVFVDVQPNITLSAEYTDIPNPGYVNIATCQCDLAYQVCDINCCCDQDCSQDYISIFHCISGYYGGDFTNNDYKLCNTTDYYNTYPWHQFTCVEFINSPLLGNYFTNISGELAPLQTESDIVMKLNSLEGTDFTFDDDNTRSTFSSGLPSTYQIGDAVSYKLNTSNSVIQHFTVPQQTLGGGCIQYALLQYGVDTTSICETTLSTTQLCTSGGKLDVSTYVLPTSPVFFTSTGTAITPQVTYLCTTALSDYVRSSTATSGGTTTVCATAPGAPTLSTSTCLSSVVGVSYDISWSSGHITAVQVTVTVADLPINSDDVLTQHLSATYSNTNASVLTEIRSGNPGYDSMYPVISGKYDNVTGLMNTSSPLAVWNPVSSLLCVDGATTPPQFGVDTTSGCVFQLTIADFSDCNLLRSTVEAVQRNLLSSANYVSRYGAPTQPVNIDDWVPIEGIDSLTSITSTSTNIQGQCGDMPSVATIQILTTTSGKIEGFPIQEIIAVKVGWTRTSCNFTCAGLDGCPTTTQQNFPVTTYVSYTQVDAVPTVAPTKFSLRDNRTCEKDAVCWPELLYPLTRKFYYVQPSSMADIQLEYNITWTLVLVLLAIGFYMIPVHWSSIGRQVKLLAPI